MVFPQKPGSEDPDPDPFGRGSVLEGQTETGVWTDVWTEGQVCVDNLP